MDRGAQLPSYVEPSADPTARELEVEILLCRGLVRKSIAEKLNVSIHTAERHMTNLYAKRGVHTHIGLLLAYLQRNGIDLERIGLNS